MYIDTVPNRNSPPAVLLRESYRVGPRTLKRTVANLSSLAPEAIEVLRRVLRGEALVSVEDAFEIERSLPHGHVAAVLGTLERIGLDDVLASRRSAQRDRVVAMIVARVLDPASKLATARGLDASTGATSLGEEFGLGEVEADDLYGALDWLGERQERIEAKLAQKHLDEGTLLLYDVSSTYFEGRTSSLAALGHNRDGKEHKLQIVFGLLCTAEGCPVAVEVFAGNTADPATLGAAITKVRDRFGLRRVVWVADRGLITQARIDQELRPVEGLDWITALRAPSIRGLVEHGELQCSLFDEQDLFELLSDRYPGERLVACRNPLLTEERRRKRAELLAATEAELEKVAQAAQRARRPLRGRERIGVRVGRVLGRFKMGKHFRYEIRDDGFTYGRDQERIDGEAALDGIYVVRTSVPAAVMSSDQVVGSYKKLAEVEQAFRSLKTVDLEVRPIYHRRDDRIRAHVFLCMLAYYVSWHMKQALAPMLFAEEDPAAAAARRASIVAPAKRSAAAQRKASRKETADGSPAHSFRTLLNDLATLTKNRVRFGTQTFDQLTAPSALQQRAFNLLGVTYRN